MIEDPILGVKYEVRFKEPIDLFEILFPAFIELRNVFEYTTMRDRLNMYDIYLQSLYTDDDGNLIHDMEERKRIFYERRHVYMGGIKDGLYELPLYCESEERDKRDRTLCDSIIIYDSVMSRESSVYKYKMNDLGSGYGSIFYKNYTKYKDYMKYKEIEMEKNRILPTIEDCVDYDEKKRFYLTSMMALLELNDEQKSVLESVLSSKILKPHIKDHGFVPY